MLRFRAIFAASAAWSCVQAKRHCSISPLGLALVFGGLAALTLGVGAAFAALGAWLILPFAGLEALALAAAFVAVARRAAGQSLSTIRSTTQPASGRSWAFSYMRSMRRRARCDGPTTAKDRGLLCSHTIRRPSRAWHLKGR